MKVTEVSVFTLEGRPRSGLALYEIARGGRATGEATPHRWTFTEVHTDEGLVGLTHGGSADVKAAGRLLIGEDPTRIEWGVRINHGVQYFWTDFYAPIRGYFPLPNGPGFGYALDPDKIGSRTDL